MEGWIDREIEREIKTTVSEHKKKHIKPALHLTFTALPCGIYSFYCHFTQATEAEVC